MLRERLVAGVYHPLYVGLQSRGFVLAHTTLLFSGFELSERVGAMRAERDARLLGLIARDPRELYAAFGRELGEGYAQTLTVGRDPDAEIRVGDSLLVSFHQGRVPGDDAERPRVFDRNRRDLRERCACAIGLGLHPVEERRRRAPGAHARELARKPIFSLLHSRF